MYISNEDFYLDLNNSAEIHKDAVLHCAVDVGEDVDAKLAITNVIKTIHHHQYYPGAWETRTVAFLCNAKNNSPSSVLSRALTLVVF